MARNLRVTGSIPLGLREATERLYRVEQILKIRELRFFDESGLVHRSDHDWDDGSVLDGLAILEIDYDRLERVTALLTGDISASVWRSRLSASTDVEIECPRDGVAVARRVALQLGAAQLVVADDGVG